MPASKTSLLQALACAMLTLPLSAAPQAPPTAKERDPARAFWANHPVVRAEIVLAPDMRARLRDKPREYAEATVRLDGVDHAKVGVKLKGSAGSFQAIDERPGFTVHLGKFGGEPRLHGLQRFHLNNGAQDDTRLHEWIGHDVFTAAGLAAPRVAHALVWLDGKLLGLYTLRESFDKQFLLRTIGNTTGNLYDGGFCQDLDQPLQKDAGNGVDDHTDLLALCELCRGVDQKREAALAAAIDIPQFVDFVALEAMLGHWDGYSRNTNNYRMWLPTGGKAVFLPHGMDQLLGDAGASVLDHPPGMAASALMQQPAFRRRYRERNKALLPLLAPSRLKKQIEPVAENVQRALRAVDPEAASAYGEAVLGLYGRIQARHEQLQVQAKAPEPKPLQLAVGKALALKTFHPAAETEGVELGKKGYQGTAALHVDCGKRDAEPRHGAWRTHLLLAKGRYALRGLARCDGIVLPPKDGEGNQHGGVTLRGHGAASERLDGDRNWTALTAEFEVGEFQANVELACDVQGFTGKAWFRVDSLQLVRLPD